MLNIQYHQMRKTIDKREVWWRGDEARDGANGEVKVMD